MLISNAVDTVTKEITQYSYFCEMSGLSKFKEFKGDLEEQATIGANNINEIVGTVDDFYSTLGSSYDKTAENLTNIKNAVTDGNVNVDNVQDTILIAKDDAENAGKNIVASINSMEASFGSVAANPLMYMKSIVAVAGNQFLDTAVSHMIAAPISKALFTKHFGKNTAEASEELKRLGVVNGLDGMNFKMSSIFATNKTGTAYSEPDSVHIVVYYKLKLIQVFDWANLEVSMCKESVGRAWLGGDAVISKIEPMTAPETPKTEDNGDGTAENTDGEATEEEKTEEEKTEEGKTEQKVDTTGSYWYLGDGGYGVENAGRDQAFTELYNKSYNIDTSKPGWYQQQKGEDGSYTGNLYYQDCALDSSYDKFDAAFYLGELNRIQDQIDDGTLPSSTKSFTYVVYVPENISDAEYNKMKENIAKGQIDYQYMIGSADDETSKQYADIGMFVQIVKAGGNYDYGSEEK